MSQLFKMPPLKIGDTFEYELTWLDGDDNPISLEGVQISAHGETTPEGHAFSFTVIPSADLSSGVCTLRLDGSQTMNLQPGATYVCDVNFVRENYSQTSEAFALPIERSVSNARK